MGPKTTPSLISKGGYQIPPPLGGREIDTPWEIGLSTAFHIHPVTMSAVLLDGYPSMGFSNLGLA